MDTTHTTADTRACKCPRSFQFRNPWCVFILFVSCSLFRINISRSTTRTWTYSLSETDTHQLGTCLIPPPLHCCGRLCLDTECNKGPGTPSRSLSSITSPDVPRGVVPWAFEPGGPCQSLIYHEFSIRRDIRHPASQRQDLLPRLRLSHLLW